jgi:hypothetical protein
MTDTGALLQSNCARAVTMLSAEPIVKGSVVIVLTMGVSRISPSTILVQERLIFVSERVLTACALPHRFDSSSVSVFRNLLFLVNARSIA